METGIVEMETQQAGEVVEVKLHTPKRWTSRDATMCGTLISWGGALGVFWQ